VLNGEGVDLELVLGEGLHIVAPWNTLTAYDAHILTHSLEMEVITSDLLKSTAEISFQYQVNEGTLPLLHKYIGPDYLERVIVPTMLTAARSRFGQYPADKAFTVDVSALSREIAGTADKLLVENINPPGLSLLRLVRIPSAEVSKMTFPPDYEKAIDQKLIQSAIAQAYQYKIQAAKSEAERLEIEGEGIRKYQQLVQAGLTDNFLRLRGIQATQALAESSNSKIVVFGNAGSSGLPLVLGDVPSKK
jgi:regulator of protease activity HflC (stomatin/prohibitin superfamily)